MCDPAHFCETQVSGVAGVCIEMGMCVQHPASKPPICLACARLAWTAYGRAMTIHKCSHLQADKLK